MKKKALNKSAFISYQKKKGGQEMKVAYSFDTRKLIDKNDNVIALMTYEGLLYLNSEYVTLDNFKHVKKFIEDYKPLGFYNKESERIYYRRRIEEENAK